MQDQQVSISENTLLQLRQENEKLVQTNIEQGQKTTYLAHELAQLKRMVFGPKRERFVPSDNGQLALGLEGIEAAGPAGGQEKEQVSYTRKKKKGKAVRLELPSHLPRETQTIEPANLVEGARKIGETVTEILEYNPGKLYVKKYLRPKYVQANARREEEIAIGELPTRITSA